MLGSSPCDRVSFSFSSGLNEHDEILVIDNVASLYGVGNWLAKYSQQHHYVPLPLAIGGGIRSIDEAINTIRLGADKVAINTSAIETPDYWMLFQRD